MKKIAFVETSGGLEYSVSRYEKFGKPYWVLTKGLRPLRGVPEFGSETFKTQKSALAALATYGKVERVQHDPH